MDFSGKHFPKEVIITAVRWYLSYPLSYRNVEELIQEWNITFDHSSVQRWVDEFGGYLMSKVRKYLKRNFKRSWRLDETYIKVKGEWCYLYRIVDSDGDSIFFNFSKTRDHQVALACVRGAIRVAGLVPEKINSDGNRANELAVKIINDELAYGIPCDGQDLVVSPIIKYTKIKYLNNILEQDHRCVKIITEPMKGFKNFHSANSTIAGVEAIAMACKNQTRLSEFNGIKVSIADQVNMLVA